VRKLSEVLHSELRIPRSDFSVPRARSPRLPLPFPIPCHSPFTIHYFRLSTLHPLLITRHASLLFPLPVSALILYTSRTLLEVTCMKRLVPLIALLFLFPAASVLAGDLPQVLQPNTTAYSASQVAALTQAMATLTEELNDYDMASRRYFSAGDWSSRDFAAYTAGVLSEEGYEVVLVSGDGWPDGVHTWVLVAVPLGGRTAWIPVEATPDEGQAQEILGHISITTDADGNMGVQTVYADFSSATQLPANLPPVAKIRRPDPPVEAGDTVKFMGIGSFDPDGEVVLYKWDFGDGRTEVSSSSSVRHSYTRSGSYVVLLSIVDNLGRSTTEDVALRVIERSEEDAPAPPSGGCGCGG